MIFKAMLSSAAERKEWREQIRRIAQDLEGASYEETLKVLTDLKTRINSFGNHGVLNDYASDAHIWKVINELEEKNLGQELYLKQKQLIEYLSLLLKSDWERTKKEVKGDVYSVLSGMFFLMTGVCFGVLLFLYNKNAEAVSMIMVIGIFAAMIIAAHILLYFENKLTYTSILKGMITSNPKQYGTGRLMVCYVLCLVGAAVLVVVFGLFVWSTFISLECDKQPYLSTMALVIIYMFGLGFQVASQYLYIDNEYHYVNAINKIRTRYERNDEIWGEVCEMCRLSEGILEKCIGRGEEKFATLTTYLVQSNRTEDIVRAASDKEFRVKLYREFKVGK